MKRTPTLRATATRAAWRLLALSLLSVGVGGGHLVTRHGMWWNGHDGTRAVYMGPVAVEHDTRRPLHVSVWACGDGWLSWRCPAESGPVIRVGHPGEVPYVRSDGWRPLTPAMARMVRAIVTTDPAGCLVRWPAEDSMTIRCVGDGTLIDVTRAEVTS